MKILNLFQKKWMLYAIISVAFLYRSWSIIFEQKFWSDQQIQMIGALSLLNGHGVSIPLTEKHDISMTHYTPIAQFPEGYSYVFAAVYFLCRSLFWSVVFIDLLAMVLYFVSWSLLFKEFGKMIPTKSQFLVFLFTGFSASPFLFYTSIDLLALSCFFLGTVMIMISLNKKNSVFTFCAVLVLFLAAFFRFMYYPVVIIVPLSIFGLAFILKNRWHRNQAILMFFYLTLFFILAQYIKTKAQVIPDYVRIPFNKESLYPENLLKFNYPFFIQPFIDERSIVTITKYLHIGTYANLAKISISLFFGGLLVIALTQFIKGLILGGYKRETVTNIFILSLFFSSLSCLLILFGLSLISIPQNNDVLINWTFVQEQRYYGIVFISIMLLALLVINNYIGLFNNRLIKITKYNIAFFAIISLMYSFPCLYITIRSQESYFLLGDKKLKYKFTNDLNLADSIDSTIKNDKAGNRKTVFISRDRISYYAGLRGASHATPEILKELYTSKEISLLIFVDEKNIDPDISYFISNRSLSPIYVKYPYKLYRYIVKPNIL